MSSRELYSFEHHHAEREITVSYVDQQPDHDRSLKSFDLTDEFIIIGKRSGNAELYRRDGTFVKQLKLSVSEVSSLKFDPEGTLAYAGCDNGDLAVINMDDFSVSRFPKSHRTTIRTIDFGPNFLVTGGQDRTITIWSRNLEPLFDITIAGTAKKIQLSNGGRELNVLVEGEAGVRRWELAGLVSELAGLSLPTPLRFE